MGLKSRKLSKTVDKMGKISCQYLTAGFSPPGATYGTTFCTKMVMSWR
jgi:hypothetical protein